MRHEVKKISRIVDELVTFFLRKDTDEVDVSIKRSTEQTVIRLIVHGTHFDSDFITHLEESLNIQRQHEIEEYYWQLAGETDCDTEITLVGAMVDSATIGEIDGDLCIEMIRKNE